jgi:hypothetical protein
MTPDTQCDIASLTNMHARMHACTHAHARTTTRWCELQRWVESPEFAMIPLDHNERKRLKQVISTVMYGVVATAKSKAALVVVSRAPLVLYLCG